MQRKYVFSEKEYIIHSFLKVIEPEPDATSTLLIPQSAQTTKGHTVNLYQNLLAHSNEDKSRALELNEFRTNRMNSSSDCADQEDDEEEEEDEEVKLNGS